MSHLKWGRLPFNVFHGVFVDNTNQNDSDSLLVGFPASFSLSLGHGETTAEPAQLFWPGWRISV